MRRLKQVLIVIFALIFIVIPAIVGMFFVLSFTSEVPYFYMWIIAIGITLYSFGIAFLLFKSKFLPIEVFNLFIPLALVFAGMFVSRDLPWWGLVIVALGLILTAIPTNILVARIRRRMALKQVKTQETPKKL